MELVKTCRAENFGIWPTLSSPVQVRIGILNQLTQSAITDIVNRFAVAMNKMGADVNIETINLGLETYYKQAIAAE